MRVIQKRAGAPIYSASLNGRAAMSALGFLPIPFASALFLVGFAISMMIAFNVLGERGGKS